MSANIGMLILIGVLTSAGVYLLIERSITRMLLGLLLFGNAINLLILTVGGSDGNPPIVGRDSVHEEIADPLAQGMILTAIVITMGIARLRSGTGVPVLQDQHRRRRRGRSRGHQGSQASPACRRSRPRPLRRPGHRCPEHRRRRIRQGRQPYSPRTTGQPRGHRMLRRPPRRRLRGRTGTRLGHRPCS